MLKIHNKNLESIAEKHYTELKGGVLSSINEIKTEIDTVLKEYKTSDKENKKLVIDKLKQYILKLGNFNKEEKENFNDTVIRFKNFKEIQALLKHLKNLNVLENILKGKPNILVKEDLEIKRLPLDLAVKNTILKKIFNYKQFTNKEKKYGAYELAKGLDVRTCLYCNRQYTFTIIKGAKDKITRPEFDHFFSQKEYPALALSFYNLIPSCKICNSTFKGDKEFTLDKYLHPYIDDFGDGGIFKYLPSGENLNYTESKDYKLFLHISGDKETLIKNHDTVFKLNEIYKEHSDIVEEIIEKSRIYTKDYIETLRKSYSFDVADIYRVCFSNYYNDEDLTKRVLSKFTKDIVNDTPNLKDIIK